MLALCTCMPCHVVMLVVCVLVLVFSSLCHASGTLVSPQRSKRGCDSAACGMEACIAYVPPLPWSRDQVIALPRLRQPESGCQRK